MTISTVKLSPLGALLFSLFAAPIGSAQDLLQCDLDSGMPGGNLPWTAVDLIDPNLSFTGWDVGPGITVDPNTAGSLGYSINGGAQDSTLVEALADGEYLTCTISPTSGSLDLGGLQVQMSNKRIDFHSARTFALFSSVDGFSEGQELFISPTANKGDLWTHSSSFIFPLAGYGNLSSPVEFRVYPFHVQYGGHKAGLADFDVVDPGPVAPISILTTGKGAVVANPAGSLLVVGSSIQVHAHADPGHRLDGWSGDLTGPGQVRTHVVLGPTVITANFSEATMPQTKLGTNLSGVVGWSTAWNFVDVWKMARPWIVAEVGSGLW